MFTSLPICINKVHETHHFETALYVDFLFILMSASIKQAIFYVLDGNKFHMPSQMKCFLGGRGGGGEGVRGVDKINNHSRSYHNREVIIKLNRKPE